MSTFPAPGTAASPLVFGSACRPLAAIIRQHAQEVSERWTRRTASADAADIDFGQRLREDRFLLAHIDGLRVAGAQAMLQVERHCPDATPGDAFARQLMALLCGTSVPPPADGTLAHAHADAPVWLDDAGLHSAMAPALQTRDGATALPALQRAARWRLPLGAALEHWLTHPHAMARRTACVCAAWGTRDSLPLLHHTLNDADPGVAGAAARARFRLGERGEGLDWMLRAVDARPAGLSPELSLLLTGLPLADSRRLLQREVQRGLAPLARIGAAEASGDPAQCDWLCAQLDDAALRPAARAALGTLTGLTLDDAADPVREDWSTRARAALVSMPLPATQDRRWLCGEVLSGRAVFDTLLYGRLRQRRFAAHHLALACTTLPRLDLLAPAPRQLAWISADEDVFTGATDA